MLANNIFVSITCVTNSLVKNLYSITAEFCKVFGTHFWAKIWWSMRNGWPAPLLTPWPDIFYNNIIKGRNGYFWFLWTI